MYVSPPPYERVVTDCDDALRQDPNYVKTFNRRATALESFNRYEESLRGLSCPVLSRDALSTLFRFRRGDDP